MSYVNDVNPRDGAVRAAAFPEYFPENSSSATPANDARRAVEVYLAYEQGILAETRRALAGYLARDCRSEVL